MDPRIANLWIERLEAGTITQLQGILGNPDGSRCCLGVLCDIAVEQGIINPPRAVKLYSNGDDKMLDYGDQDQEVQYYVLPDKVREWANMKTPNGVLCGRESGTSLSGMNDNDSSSFSQIAEAIRMYQNKL